MKLLLALTVLAVGCDAGRASKGRVAGVVEKRQSTDAAYKTHTIDQPVYLPLFQLCHGGRDVRSCNSTPLQKKPSVAKRIPLRDGKG